VLCRRQEKQPASSSSNHTRTQADRTESSLISLKLWFWSSRPSLFPRSPPSTCLSGIQCLLRSSSTGRDRMAGSSSSPDDGVKQHELSPPQLSRSVGSSACSAGPPSRHSA
jgi:hypothetical protein